MGNRGRILLNNLSRHSVTALCDVDSAYAAGVFEKFPDAARYRDYRVMLREVNEIDAVVIATPDHTHAVIATAALRAGKHVYCEKPLAHNIREARHLAAEAGKSEKTAWMGIQGHSGEGMRVMREWVEAGLIGEVREVDAWCNLSYHPAGHAWWSPRSFTRPRDTPAVPETLDWDLWIGPAPMRPYHPLYHPKTWRAWLDFGNGWMGDRGAHTLDPVIWSLQLGLPERIEAAALPAGPEAHALASVVSYRFPARGAMPPVTVNWFDGLRPPQPDAWGEGEALGSKEGGCFLKGAKGYITAGMYGESPRLHPASLMEELRRNPPAKKYPRVRGTHEMAWAAAAKHGLRGGNDPDFAYSAKVTEVCLLGNIAKRIGAPLLWDGEAGRFTNSEEANQFVGREYREGWTLG